MTLTTIRTAHWATPTMQLVIPYDETIPSVAWVTPLVWGWHPRYAGSGARLTLIVRFTVGAGPHYVATGVRAVF